MTMAGNGGVAAQALLAYREEILADWADELRRTVPAAQPLAEPILYDTVPVFLDNLAEALMPGYPRTLADAESTIAMAHGGERAQLSDYTAQDVVTEYHCLQNAVLAVLRRHGVALSGDAERIVVDSHNAAIRRALTVFSATQQRTRERYVATLAHDLRSPLSVIMHAAHLLRAGVDPLRTPYFADKIIASVQRAEALVGELLDTAALQNPEALQLDLTEFDLYQLVMELVAQLPPGTRCRVTGSSVRGHWCRRLLARALENLLGNAMKYGDGSGIEVRMIAYHGRVGIGVHNRGRTIPPEQLGELFAVFKRATADAVEGWGLGLAFVKHVAESHGGTVGIDSSPERGTTVTVDIPVDATPFQRPGQQRGCLDAREP